MKLKFFNPEELDKTLKATIHRTGKLGFTAEAAEKMGLTVEQSMGIAMDEESQNSSILYVEIYSDVREGAFKISRAGNYFYLSAKHLFDTLKYDYTKESIAFDISKESIDGKTYYKFKRRETKNKHDKREMALA